MSASAIPAPRARALRLSYDERSALLFVLPFAVVLFAVAVFPIVYSFYISLYSLRLTRPNRVPFVWFDNYVTVLSRSAVLGRRAAHRRVLGDGGRGDVGASAC